MIYCFAMESPVLFDDTLLCPWNTKEMKTRKLAEELFLEACFPAIRKLMEESRRCSGCSPFFEPNQLAHECMVGFPSLDKGYCDRDLLKVALPRIETQAHAIFAHMWILCTRDRYKTLNLGDLLQAFGGHHHTEYPFYRIQHDEGWFNCLALSIAKGVFCPEGEDQVDSTTTPTDFGVGTES